MIARSQRWVDMMGALAPFIASVILLLVGMASLMWWGPDIAGTRGWQTPQDLWRTYVAADRMAHLHLAGIYTEPTTLVSFPGAALILTPAAWLIRGLGLTPGPPVTTVADGSGWWVLGPYEILISCSVLFAADAAAKRLQASIGRRYVLAGASAVALWSVSVRWGHPEDCVAVALLVWAVLGLAENQLSKAAWLTGAAIVVQPLVLLGVPAMAATIPMRRWPAALIRAVIPTGILLGAAFVANPSATYHAVIDQPNWPQIDHPTPWIFLAPSLGGGTVAAGPGRLVAIALCLALAAIVRSRTRTWLLLGQATYQVRPRNFVLFAPALGAPLVDKSQQADPLEAGACSTRWPCDLLAEVMWWLALALALRCFFESVMVAYYVWPSLAIALIASVPWWRRLLPASASAIVLTFASQSSWRSEWGWWLMVVSLLMVTLAASWRWGANPPPATMHLGNSASRTQAQRIEPGLHAPAHSASGSSSS